jgi:hypothetical protein
MDSLLTAYATAGKMPRGTVLSAQWWILSRETISYCKLVAKIKSGKNYQDCISIIRRPLLEPIFLYPPKVEFLSVVIKIPINCLIGKKPRWGIPIQNERGTMWGTFIPNPNHWDSPNKVLPNYFTGTFTCVFYFFIWIWKLVPLFQESVSPTCLSLKTIATSFSFPMKT